MFIRISRVCKEKLWASKKARKREREDCSAVCVRNCEYAKVGKECVYVYVCVRDVCVRVQCLYACVCVCCA